VIAPTRATAIGTLVVAGLAAGGVVVATGNHGGKPKPAGAFVAAERGRVSVTVGGIGHVTTLSGAARLSVPAAGGSAPTGSAGGSAAQASSAGAAQVPADAVFATVAAHVSRVLVHTGQFVLAGEPIATLVDDGTLATQELQASSDLATARLELAQKRVRDPSRGPQPTPAEIQAGHQSILTAQAKLHRLLGRPLPADVALARSDLAKALADLKTTHGRTPAAISAAELAVATAQQKLQTVTGAPNPMDVATAQLELARATLDQETALRVAPGPTPTAVAAADAAIALAQQHLANAQASGTASDVAAARAELAKAQADREALFITPPAPTQAARTAAQLAVDAAQRRVDDLLHPPASIVSAARTELAKTQADLEMLRLTHGPAGTAAARAAVAAAKARLALVTGHPLRDVVATARFDLAKARADLAILGQRGSPATPSDLALARLKLDVAGQRLALARRMGGRLIVHAPATGTVTSVLTTAGAAVDAVTPIARVQDLRHLVVALDLSEFDVGRTRVGTRAQVSVDALGGRKVRGRVLDIALSGADNGGGIVNFPVTIAVPSGHGLRPGMSVSARIVVREVTGVIQVPTAAVTDYGQNSVVMVRRPGGGLQRRVVELGLQGPHSVEIRSGLRAGERVFVPAGA
jgi:RND family efflux transporter MFP subunit